MAGRHHRDAALQPSVSQRARRRSTSASGGELAGPVSSEEGVEDRFSPPPPMGGPKGQVTICVS